MARVERKIHKNFIEYQHYIVNHPNYASLPNKFSKEGEITWVKVKDEYRTRWWDTLKKELKAPDRATVARMIHPPELNGMKPCQVCGENLSIHYRYLNSSSFAQIKLLIPQIDGNQFESTIDELLTLSEKLSLVEAQKLLMRFTGRADISIPQGNNGFVVAKGTHLSPGVMSNAPDRLDGFHTYNACCRGIQDTGRHKSNLARYAQDRRAYENWAEGDWRGANRLMGVFASTKDLVECPKCKKLKKMTGDHIGPISLGFCHRMKFNPLCTECNSAKNNRMTLANVQSLIADELKGEIVVSWHTKALWNALKSRIKNNEDAIRFSVLLRKNMHFVLSVLAVIAEANGKKFLNRYLNPQYASYDYTFTKFNPKDGTFRAERFQVDSKNTKSNAARYVRISFESLEEYSNKTNRRTVMNDDPALASEIQSIVRFVEKDEFERAHTLLLKVIEKKSKALALEF